MGEWTTEPLDDCLESLIDYRGKSPTKSLTGIPVLSAKVVKTTGLLRPIEQTIAPDYYPKWMTRGLPRPGDIVMTTEAPMGEVIQLNAETCKFALGQRIVCMRGKAKKLDNTFLRYLLTSPGQQEILASYSTGTTVLGISQKALRSVPISFPDFDEQVEIGELLSALDDKIELNRRMNETLEASARALFRDWFVDFGPVKAKVANAPATLAPEIWSLFPAQLDDEGKPEGWEWGTLGDYAKIQNGFAFSSNDWAESGVPVVKIGSVKPGLVDLGQVSFVSEQLANERVAFRLNAGDMLIGLTGYVGETGFVPPTPCLPLLNQRVGRLIPNKYASAFTFCALRNPEFKEYAVAQSHGSAQANVSTKSLLEYPLPLIPEQLIKSFEIAVAPLFSQILHNFGESRTLAQTRDRLLPKLMSGEIRVADAARAADDAAGVAL